MMLKLVLVQFVVALVPSALSRPADLLWPLDEMTYSTEVLKNSAGPVDQTLCSASFGEQPPGYPNKVHLLDGSKPIDLILDDPSVYQNRDYSFSMMVKPSVQSAALLHFRSLDQTQSFRDMILYIVDGRIAMRRSLGSVNESSSLSSQVMTTYTWHFVSFGIDYGNGEPVRHFDGMSIRENGGYVRDTGIVLPGILRVGGAFDDSHPNLVGAVGCVGFFDGAKEPKQDDAGPQCTSPTWSSNVPDCTATPAINRTTTGYGYFESEAGIHLSMLNLISSSVQCTDVRCATSCLQNRACWYFRYDINAQGCQPCHLYDSSIVVWKQDGDVEQFLYKWKANK